MTRPSHLLAVLLSVFATAACSSDPAAPEGSAAGSGGSAAGGSSSGGTSSGGSASAQRCPDGDNPASAPSLLEVGSVSGLIVDERGEPTSAGLVQICGKDVCTQADVGKNGRLSEGVGDTRDTPAVKYGDGFEWAKLTRLLSEGDNDLGTLVTVRLPAYEDAVALEPGQAASSGGVTLQLDDSARVEVNFLDYESEEQQGFRAAALPAAALEQLSPQFVQAYALSPLETRICPSPALRVDNTAELEPGTELELYVLGLDVEEEFAPYAAWQKFGEGAVSEDGATLDFPDGIPVLTAIGVRVKE